MNALLTFLEIFATLAGCIGFIAGSFWCADWVMERFGPFWGLVAMLVLSSAATTVVCLLHTGTR